MPLADKIEILPITLLDQNRALVEELKALAGRLGIGLGWHYLLDLSWIISQLPAISGQYILDAGAGSGLMQWYLAGRGADVLSVDRGSRAMLSLRFRAAYRVSGMRKEDLAPASKVIQRNVHLAHGLVAKSKAWARGAGAVLSMVAPRPGKGQVRIYNTNLEELDLVKDKSLDAVVAVSALEHNSAQGLRSVVGELLRVLKPGGVLLATLGAGRDKDWFHEPSKGWNYTDASLRSLFDLAPEAPSNYDRHDELMAALRDCSELRDHLASFYFQSGDNGMPWGKWDPQYQPVGVLKVKR